MSQYHTLILILILTTAAFVAWMVLLFFVWLFLRLLGVAADFWALTEALSTASPPPLCWAPALWPIES